MKNFLLSILLAIAAPTIVRAQDAETQARAAVLAASPANERFGWFHTEEWATDRMLAEPGWKISGSGKTDAGTYVTYVANNYSQGVTIYLYNGTVGAALYIYSTRQRWDEAALLAGYEQVATNEWISRKDNARIKRRYNGNFIEYRIDFEPFDKD